MPQISATFSKPELLIHETIRNYQHHTQNSEGADINPYLDQDDERVPATGQTFEVPRTGQAGTGAAIQNWHIATRTAPNPCINPTSREVFETRSISRSPNSKYKSKQKKNSFGQRKTRLLGEASSVITTLPLSISQQWNLGDFTTTMTDILSGKTFRRETNNMKLRKRHQREIARVERAQKISIGLKGSAITTRTAQTDPLYQNGFSSSMQGQFPPPRATSLTLTPPATPEPQDVFAKSLGARGPKTANSSTNAMTYENILFPSPPRSRNGRLSPQDDHPLPNLPENPPAVLPPPKVRNNPPGLSIPTGPTPRPGLITLSSTPFSLTYPLFRHGPVRVDQRREYFSPEDESLDWTAFQISIIGVMDDNENVNDAPDLTECEEELDDIVSWFSDFGFEIGSMIKEGPDGWIKAYV
jgi:hypothetical protein